MNKTINKSILALLACSAAFCACSREEADLFDKSAADRLNEVSDLYSARLSDQGGEWIMEYYPTNEVDSATSAYAYMAQGYLMCNKFNSDGSVLVAMNNAFSANKYMESVSAWEVLTDLGPVLSYNSYNECIHTFSNPQEFSFNGWTGDNGVGVGGDYEFVITNLEENCTASVLKGKKRGSYSLISRLPENTNFEEYLADVNEFGNNNFPSDMANDMIMTIGSDKFYVRDLYTGIATIWPYDGTWADNKTYHPFLVTKIGDNYRLRFREAITSSDDVKVQEMMWDESTYQFVDTKDNKNVIRGLEAADYPSFYMEAIGKLGWVFASTVNKETSYVAASDGAMAIINRLAEGYLKKDKRYLIQGIKLKAEEGVALLTITYKKNAVATNDDKYMFNLRRTDKGVAFEYVGPNDNGGASVTSSKDLTIDGMQEFLDMFAHEFTLSDPVATGFCIKQIRMTQSDNNNIWIVPMYAITKKM